MATKFLRLGSASDSPSRRRRKVERVRAQTEARLASSRGEEVMVWLGDASTHGCSVRCDAEWLRTGRFVTVALVGDQPVQAVVRWVRDGVAGLEFLRPLPATMTEWKRLIEQPFG